MPLSEAWVDFIAGWASGAVSVLAIQPVDTVLTQLQAGKLVSVTPASAASSSAAAAATGTAAGATTSATTTLMSRTNFLVRNFGMTSLWRGSSAMIGAVPLQNSMLMGGYGIGKQWAEESSSSTTTSSSSSSSSSTVLWSVFFGGCTGGVIQSFLMTPVELIKVNQQVIGASAKKATMDMVQGLLVPARAASTTSSTSSWRGLNATLMRDGVPHGVWFASYEWCKTSLDQQWDAFHGIDDSTASNTTPSTGKQLAVPLTSGAFAATVAWAVGYPFDIIKTRIQASPASYSKGIYATGVELVQEANGRVWVGLYRGFGLKLLRSIPASMIGFTTYEWVAQQIRSNGSV